MLPYIKDVRKKVLETLAETKTRKQQEGEEVKRTKKSRTKKKPQKTMW